VCVRQERSAVNARQCVFQVCVRERAMRERAHERQRAHERDGERERERVCVCV